jgi:translocation and assembly module TamA
LRVVLCFIALLLCVPLVNANSLRLEITGLHGELKENVEGRLSTMNKSDVADTPEFKRYLSGEISKGLRALGYYSPQIQFSVKKTGTTPTFVASVVPGEPVLIKQVTVNVSGQGQQDADYIHLLKTDVPATGDVLNHGIYDKFKKRLQTLALSKGYFEAEMTHSELGVAAQLHQAFWNIDFNTHERYRFGKVTFREQPIRESYLRNIIPFKEGEYYSSESLSLFNRRLSSTNWFNSVTIIPNMAHTNQKKEIPFYVIATPKKKNIIDMGLGYSTDVGVRSKIGWSKPWLNDRGHSFQSNLSLSKVEQIVTGSYKIPLHRSPLEDYYTLQGGFKHEDNNDTRADSYNIAVIRHWDNFDGWQKAVGLNASYDEFTQADYSYDTFLVYPSFSLYRARQRGQLLPMWGDSQRYSLELSSTAFASDINFWRFSTQQVWIRSFHDYHRFIARANLGIVDTNDFKRVPPSFRYFAGGDRSIRGYSYQSISPKDNKGKLLGASRLLTGSLEYQYNFTGNWWSAMFIDSGEAVNDIRDNDFHTGAGAGIRWVSPIGPIKMDIATPIGNKDGRSIHFYIGIGAEL